MTSEVEERPGLITAGYGRHRSQWVKVIPQNCIAHPYYAEFYVCLVCTCKQNGGFFHTAWLAREATDFFWKLVLGPISFFFLF